MSAQQSVLERSLLANDAHRAFALQHVVAEGASSGDRVVMVQPDGGIHARVLPDRGLDVGAAWFEGRPVSWTSAVGECRGGACDDGLGWLRGWGGGLLTTCGLRNVGLPSEGHGQHGTVTDLRARDLVVCRRRESPESPEHVVVTGTLVDAGIGRSLVLRRRIVFTVGTGQVMVHDRLRNDGSVTEQAPVLYHVNFGFPFLEPRSRLVGAYRTLGDDQTPFRTEMGPPQDEADQVVEHLVQPGASSGRGDEGSWAALTLTSPRTGLAATVSWRTETLPRVHTWRRWSPGAYVMAVEPANCSVEGRAADREAGRAPMLEPGQERCTDVAVTVGRLIEQEGAQA